MRAITQIIGAALALSLTLLAEIATAQESIPVRVAQVREEVVERVLPLTGRIYSRNDASISLTLAGELEYVLEPGTRVPAGGVFGRLDQRPILLRKSELEHLAAREQVNGDYLQREQLRLRRLKEANNASERLVDESASKHDVSRMELRSLQARIEQIDDELRRSQLVAPFAGVIAERHKRGGEYARTGDVIARLVDLANLELRFQVPVGYLGRVTTEEQVAFRPQGGQSLGENKAVQQATVRTIIPAANIASQTFEVRANIDSAAGEAVIAGQLVNISLHISSTHATLQIPRDAIVLRAEGNYVFRIDPDDTAHKVRVEVGEGSREWVSVTGDLHDGDWVATRGIERLQDGQAVARRES